MKTFETIYAFIIGVCEFLAYWYVRLYWEIALGTAIFLLLAAEGGIKGGLNQFTLADGLAALAIANFYILFTMLWGILFLLEKLSNSRPPRHYRKDENNDKIEVQ